MPARLDIWLDLDRQLAVEGPASTNRAELRVFQGDTLELVLHGLRFNRGSLPGQPYDAAHIDWHTLKAGILKVDAPPSAGTWKLDVDGTLTAALTAGVAKADLATALNLLANVTAAGGLTVEAGGAANIWRIQWTIPANALPIAVAAKKLTPFCFDRISSDDDMPGRVEVKIFQAPVAFTDQFALPNPPAVLVTRVVAGTAGRNEVQRVRIPAGAQGQFAFTTQGRGLIPVGTVTAAILATTLNAPFVAANPADLRFKVTAPAVGVFDLEFIGTLAAAAQDLLAVEMFDQVPLDTPTAALPLTALAVEDALDGAPSAALLFEITAADEAGKEFTLCQQAISVVNDGLDAPMALNIPDWLVSAQQAASESLDPLAPIISGTLSYRGELSVVAEPLPGSRAWTVNHGLGTLFPLPIVYDAVGRRRLTPFVEYDWEVTDANTCVITFAVAPDAETIQLLVASFEAATVLNNHEHPWTQIYRLNGDATKTYLPAIIAALEASLPDGWPNVPGAKIVNGSITPDKLDLEALAAALKLSAKFLETLVALMGDTSVLTAIANSLLTSDSFLTNLANNATFVNALTSNATFVTNLLSNPTFLTAIKTVFLDLAQGALLGDAILIRLPDHDAAFPPMLAGSTPAAPLYPTLPAVQISPANLGGGTVTGYVVRAAAANANKKLTVVTVAHLAPHRRKTFADGAVIFSDGFDWWKAAVDGTNYYAAEFDRQLFALHVNETMLGPGTRFAVSFAFSLQLLGGLEGYYLFELRRGTANSATVSPRNLSDVTWDEVVISQPLILSDSAVNHVFGYTVTRTAGDVLSATKKSYLLTAAATAPAAPKFVLEARLTHFDMDSTAAPRGQVKLIMKAAAASIVKL